MPLELLRRELLAIGLRSGKRHVHIICLVKEIAAALGATLSVLLVDICTGAPWRSRNALLPWAQRVAERL